MNRFYSYLSMSVLLVGIALPAFAHDGRRFQIEVRDNVLRAQGANSNGVPMDPAGLRGYYNAIHGHWSNLTNPPTADLPGYDAGFGAGALASYDVFLTITGARKWINVSDSLVDPNATGDMSTIIAGAQVKPNTVPDLQVLDSGESLEINFGGIGGETVTTADLGVGGADLTLKIIDAFDGKLQIGSNGIVENPDPSNPSNGYDIDVTYLYQGPSDPLDTLYIIEAQLSTDAPGIGSSETIYTILSPDGTGPIQRLHFAALFLEKELGTIPEPTTLAVLASGGVLFLLRRRTS